MAYDERFRRYQEAGADFIGAARDRAEELVRELGAFGGSSQRQATDHVLDLIRREITSQLSQLGLATKEDLAALEHRMAARIASASVGARSAAPGRAGEADEPAGGEGAPAPRKAPAKKAPAAKKRA